MTTEVLHKESISPGEVRCQLERLLANRRFAASERSATFLRYVVDRTLAGDSAGIKEVVIATEIYGRSADYRSKNRFRRARGSRPYARQVEKLLRRGGLTRSGSHHYSQRRLRAAF